MMEQAAASTYAVLNRTILSESQGGALLDVTQSWYTSQQSGKHTGVIAR